MNFSEDEKSIDGARFEIKPHAFAIYAYCDRIFTTAGVWHRFVISVQFYEASRNRLHIAELVMRYVLRKDDRGLYSSDIQNYILHLSIPFIPPL